MPDFKIPKSKATLKPEATHYWAQIFKLLVAPPVGKTNVRWGYMDETDEVDPHCAMFTGLFRGREVIYAYTKNKEMLNIAFHDANPIIPNFEPQQVLKTTPFLSAKNPIIGDQLSWAHPIPAIEGVPETTNVLASYLFNIGADCASLPSILEYETIHTNSTSKNRYNPIIGRSSVVVCGIHHDDMQSVFEFTQFIRCINFHEELGGENIMVHYTNCDNDGYYTKDCLYGTGASRLLITSTAGISYLKPRAGAKTINTLIHFNPKVSEINPGDLYRALTNLGQ